MVTIMVGSATGIAICYYVFRHQQKQREAQLLAKVVDAYISLETHLQHDNIEEKDTSRLKEDFNFTLKCLTHDMNCFLELNSRSKTQESTMDKLGVLLTILSNTEHYVINEDELKKALKFSSYQTLNEV